MTGRFERLEALIRSPRLQRTVARGTTADDAARLTSFFPNETGSIQTSLTHSHTRAWLAGASLLARHLHELERRPSGFPDFCSLRIGNSIARTPIRGGVGTEDEEIALTLDFTGDFNRLGNEAQDLIVHGLAVA